MSHTIGSWDISAFPRSRVALSKEPLEKLAAFFVTFGALYPYFPINVVGETNPLVFIFGLLLGLLASLLRGGNNLRLGSTISTLLIVFVLLIAFSKTAEKPTFSVLLAAQHFLFPFSVLFLLFMNRIVSPLAIKLFISLNAAVAILSITNSGEFVLFLFEFTQGRINTETAGYSGLSLLAPEPSYAAFSLATVLYLGYFLIKSKRWPLQNAAGWLIVVVLLMLLTRSAFAAGLLVIWISSLLVIEGRVRELISSVLLFVVIFIASENRISSVVMNAFATGIHGSPELFKLVEADLSFSNRAFKNGYAVAASFSITEADCGRWPGGFACSYALFISEVARINNYSLQELEMVGVAEDKANTVLANLIYVTHGVAALPILLLFLFRGKARKNSYFLVPFLGVILLIESPLTSPLSALVLRMYMAPEKLCGEEKIRAGEV